MINRLPVALSSAAIVIALFGATPAGEAARGVTAAFAKNAAKLGGFKPSKTSKKNTVVVRGANGKIDQASLPVIRGERGLQGPPGERGLQGPQGERGPEGPPSPDAVNAQNADKLDGFDSTHFAAQATIAALEARVAALETKLAAVSYDSSAKLLRVTGANLQIVDGSGDTIGATNGLGNLIIGYNADSAPANDRSGSHYLIVGDDHTYAGFGGIVVGRYHTVSGEWASVSGGTQNTASGDFASVTAGVNNTASGIFSSVAGGAGNSASENASSVTGGAGNQATGAEASVSGGNMNIASGMRSSVTGGLSNRANGGTSSVSGGRSNTTPGLFASVTGGEGNSAAEQYQWLGGTFVLRSAITLVEGGAIGNGDYHTAAATATCLANQTLFGGGAFWSTEVDDEELPLISSRPTADLSGWTARGGNDGSTTNRQFNVHALCLGP